MSLNELDRLLQNSECTKEWIQTFPDWFSHNIPQIQESTQSYVGRELSMLEIGVLEGISTKWFLTNVITNLKSSYVSVDTFSGSGGELGHELEKFDKLREIYIHNISSIGREVTIIADYSYNALLNMLHQKHEQFDIIFVDGSHTGYDVLTDAVLCFYLLKVGGLMMFDDYEWGKHAPNFRRPGHAIDSFIECFSPFIKIVHKGYQLHIVKITEIERRPLNNTCCQKKIDIINE